MATISMLKKGEKGIIEESLIAIPLTLIELGCFPGREIEMIQPAPLNDPICIKINNTRIAIRQTLAEKIKIEKI